MMRGSRASPRRRNPFTFSGKSSRRQTAARFAANSGTSGGSSAEAPTDETTLTGETEEIDRGRVSESEERRARRRRRREERGEDEEG